jgi:competence protein ComEC
MRRIGARAAGSAVALPGPRALARPAVGAWLAGGLRREAEQRRLFPWLAVAFGTGILVYFAAVDGTPVLAAPLAGAALAAAPLPFLGARPAALALDSSASRRRPGGSRRSPPRSSRGPRSGRSPG